MRNNTILQVRLNKKIKDEFSRWCEDKGGVSRVIRDYIYSVLDDPEFQDPISKDEEGDSDSIDNKTIDWIEENLTEVSVSEIKKNADTEKNEWLSEEDLITYLKYLLDRESTDTKSDLEVFIGQIEDPNIHDSLLPIEDLIYTLEAINQFGLESKINLYKDNKSFYGVDLFKIDIIHFYKGIQLPYSTYINWEDNGYSIQAKGILDGELHIDGLTPAFSLNSKEIARMRG